MSTAPFHTLSHWFPQQQVIPLWPKDKALPPITPNFQERSQNSQLPDREVSQVIHPEIVVITPKQSNGIGALIMPGGSYRRVALDKEGMDSAYNLCEKGYTLFVMTYRMPADGHEEGNQAPLADAQRALRLIRAQAKCWSLHHIGVIGFSAGGHAAAMLATHYADHIYTAVDDADTLSARPDFTALMYPVISMDYYLGHSDCRAQLLGATPSASDIESYSLQTQVNPTTPPCFLLHASDDLAVKAENSLLFWQALRANHVPAELHIFERGGHGFGLRGVQGLPAHHWPELLDHWLNSQFDFTEC